MHARKSDPVTSQVSASAIIIKAPGIEQDILNLMARYPHGLTIQQISDLSGINLVTVSPRIAPLRRRGQVRATGKRRNPSGKQAIVWSLCGEASSASAESPAPASIVAVPNLEWLHSSTDYLNACTDLLEVIERISTNQ